jgi:hypothetical protein
MAELECDEFRLMIAKWPSGSDDVVWSTARRDARRRVVAGNCCCSYNAWS